MACANPLTIKNPHFDRTGTKALPQYFTQYYKVPCGWCLNCRVDKRNYLKDCLNYEYNNYGCGSFVTFTYDDNHLAPLLRQGADGKINATLCRDDYIHFLYRLRSTIARKKLNDKLINPRFKYLCVGEYGDEFQRPHFHIIFLGLDWLACEKLFLDNWKNGLIDSLPIKEGCFDYVLKYLDKQVHGKQAMELYDNQGLERPFHTHSTGLGKGLYLQQMDYILNHNYCYKSEHNLDRPLPNYWKNKLFGKTKPDYKKYRDVMRSYNVKGENHNNIYGYSLKQMNDFKHKQAILRAQNIYAKSIQSGRACDFVIDNEAPQSDYNFYYLVDVATNLQKGG